MTDKLFSLPSRLGIYELSGRFANMAKPKDAGPSNYGVQLHHSGHARGTILNFDTYLECTDISEDDYYLSARVSVKVPDYTPNLIVLLGF